VQALRGDLLITVRSVCDNMVTAFVNSIVMCCVNLLYSQTGSFESANLDKAIDPLLSLPDALR
jgi:hypothetical protein